MIRSLHISASALLATAMLMTSSIVMAQPRGGRETSRGERRSSVSAGNRGSESRSHNFSAGDRGGSRSVTTPSRREGGSQASNWPRMSNGGSRSVNEGVRQNTVSQNRRNGMRDRVEMVSGGSNNGGNNGGGDRTGFSGNNNNRPGGNIGDRPNGGSRPGNGGYNNRDNGGSRPGNGGFNNRDNGGSRPGNGGFNNRDNGGSRPGNHGGGNMSRPGGSGYHIGGGDRPGNHGGGNMSRPGGSGYHIGGGDRPGAHAGGHAAPPSHGMITHRPGSWHTPVAPPMRTFRPVDHHIFRPVPPPGFRPWHRAPIISGILGLAFGTAYYSSLDYLFNRGYEIDGYYNNIVYLRNIQELSCFWPDVMLNYGSSQALSSAEFHYSTSYDDLGRFNRLYSELNSRYGQPVSYNEDSNGIRSTWYGGNARGFVSLEYYYSSGRYYTTLAYGV